MDRETFPGNKIFYLFLFDKVFPFQKKVAIFFLLYESCIFPLVEYIFYFLVLISFSKTAALLTIEDTSSSLILD